MPMPRDVFTLSPEQFARLEELLTPGYECAKMMLADYQARAPVRDAIYSEDGTAPNPPVDDPSKQGSG